MLDFLRSLSWPARIGFVLLVCCTLLSLGMTVANAQTVPGTVNLSWTLPTTGCTPGVSPCDNKPLTGVDALTGVDVYIATATIPTNTTMLPTLQLGATATQTTHTMQVTNGGSLFIRLKVRTARVVSGFTNEVTKVIEVPVTPGVPTNVTITLTINTSP